MRVREPPKGNQYWGSLCSFSLFYRQKITKQSKRQVYRNTQKQCDEAAQKENIRLRSSPCGRLASNRFPGFGGSVGGVKKNITRNLRTGGLKHQHHCRGDWKQQDLVTKSTQTQYGGKFDGQFHKKRPEKGKKQRGYTTERFMPRNNVIMLTF